jgi:hypothetical protein
MDFGDRVSQEAKRIEFEQTQEYIREGIQQRVSRTFGRGGLVTQVIFDPLSDQYVVTCRYVQDGKKFASTTRLAYEQIYGASAQLDTWRTYLDETAARLKLALRAELLNAGIKTVPIFDDNIARNPGYQVSATGWSSSTTASSISREIRKLYETGQSRPISIRDELYWHDEIDKAQEQEAIESIKRSAQRVQSEEP